MTSVVIGGDIVPSFKNLEYFSNGDVTKIADEECRKVLESADIRVFNLETPITETINPILKEGANFSVPRLCINGINALRADVISLANNHCKDQGEPALLETIELLNSAGIKTVGYEKKGADDFSCIYLKKNGVKIAIIACAEIEFTIANEREYGAVPYDAVEINKNIKKAKENCDAVIVLYHGGKEYCQYPAPYLLQRCRMMADNGADVILCQHSHCIGCYEMYNSSCIVYGQGNFIFHQKNNKPQTKQGLLVKVEICEKEVRTSFFPVILNDEDTVCIAKGSEYDEIMGKLKERSNLITQDGQAEKLFSECAEMYIESYLGKLRKMNFWKRVLRKIGVFDCKRDFNREELLSILNILQNEAHRELFIRGIKNIINKEERI